MHIIVILIVSPLLCAAGWCAVSFIRQHVLKNIARSAVITATIIPILGGNLSGMVMFPLWYHAWQKFFVFDPAMGIIQIALWTIGLSVIGNAFYFSGRKSNPQQSLGGVSENRAEDGALPGAPQG
jgi:hypothetical protein